MTNPSSFGVFVAFCGLVCISFAIGSRTSEWIGWLVLGIGLMLGGIFHQYLP